MKKILKISFISALIGVLILIILSQQIEPKLYDIEEIDETMLNQYVKISGEIFKILTYDDFQVIMIEDDTSTIKITANSNITKSETISKKYLVIGKVTEYKEEIQISANKIIELS